jgi:starch-binding outer membrane protein, SusD/RagB family
MKIIKYVCMFSLLGGLFLISCESTYLDKMIESDGFTDDNVFGDSVNYHAFVDNLILIPSIKRMDDGYNPLGDFDDLSDNSLSGSTAQSPSMLAASGDYYGLRGNYSSGSDDGLWNRLWSRIRIANVGLKNIDKYPGSVAARNRIIGQCLYFRADSYMELVRRWGGMPYLYEPVDAAANMDFVRLGYQESLFLVAEDFAEAAKYLPATVPPSEFQFPTSVAALALKSRVLLYAASPYATSQPGAQTNLWTDAALAADQAIRAAENAGHTLIDFNDYYYLFKGDREEVYLKEVLFGRRYQHAWGGIPYTWRYRPPGQLGGNYGAKPNQTLVDEFDMQASGLPIDDAASGYVEQNPYSGRDPRFYHNIMHNQQTVMDIKMQIYNRDGTVNPPIEGSPSLQVIGGNITMGFTTTGYYINKWIGNTFNANLPMVWSDIRLAELYLNFAEAANEALSSPTEKNPTWKYSALEALNKVRTRAQMPELHSKFFTKNAFRNRVWSERRVELCFEDHRLYDIRRWRVAHLPDYRDIYGMFITKVPVSEQYPTGFSYQRQLVLTRSFEERNYLFVIKLNDTRMGPNFTQNPGY